MIRFAATIALLLAGTSLAAAQTLDEEITSFINAEGFEPRDAFALETELSEAWLDIDSLSPGGRVGPIEKAMMLADLAIPAQRTRSDIAYGEILGEDGAPTSFIEIRHFNLGPVIRADTADAYGEENTAPLEDFGVGDHMAWRFVLRPEMNNAAILIEASSRLITDKEASKAECSGRPCLDPYLSFDDVDWQQIDGKLPTWPPLYPTESEDVATPAHAIAQLAVFGYWASAESGEYQWTGGEHPEGARGAEPYRFIAIDRQLGQEASIDTVWRETKLNDDSLSAISFRRQEAAGEIVLMRASESR
ncbi:MAG: hypothetical protein ABS75_14550 [Pelagibacterium sp. SCN 63-23]|nr:MAG: hypothetical protein ABS75_14550 [Pelagibacterium sp. SCN 63-23]